MISQKNIWVKTFSIIWAEDDSSIKTFLFLKHPSSWLSSSKVSTTEPERKKQRGRGSQHSEMSELTLAVPPRTSLSPYREFSPVLFTRPDQHPTAAASDLVSFGGSDDARWTTACHWQLQKRRSCRARTMIQPPCILRSPAHQAQAWTPIFSASCLTLWRRVWNGLPQEEPFRSHLDEWFLPERGQAPRQQSSPFFPEVHDEITKSWHAPYSSRLRASSSFALTSFEGTEEKGYDSLPPLDESVAAHLCPPTASGRKAKAAHPSKLCRMTSALAGRAYSSAGQAASALHSKVVLQVLQAKLLCSMDESNPNPAAFNELCSATDLALRHQDDSSGDRQIHGKFSGAWALSVVEPDRDEGCG